MALHLKDSWCVNRRKPGKILNLNPICIDIAGLFIWASHPEIVAPWEIFGLIPEFLVVCGIFKILELLFPNNLQDFRDMIWIAFR